MQRLLDFKCSHDELYDTGAGVGKSFQQDMSTISQAHSTKLPLYKTVGPSSSGSLIWRRTAKSIFNLSPT